MKTEKSILIAFILNFSFSIFELVGGAFTNSVAIISDAFHDMGDALSIGVSYFLEKKSKKKPDMVYTYGYARYSVIGSVLTTIILLVGSVAVIAGAANRIVNPARVNYNGMIIFAVVGVIVNFAAAYFTSKGESLNQKAVNLHMLEDVLGWVVVLIGAVIMKFTDFVLIDPIMSIAVAAFIFINALKNLKEILDLFLEKIPEGIDPAEIKHHLMEIEGISDIHHIHIRSIDGYKNSATMHVVAETGESRELKEKIREELKEHGIAHSTLEFETPDEECNDICCDIETATEHSHHHHHH